MFDGLYQYCSKSRLTKYILPQSRVKTGKPHPGVGRKRVQPGEAMKPGEGMEPGEAMEPGEGAVFLFLSCPQGSQSILSQSPRRLLDHRCGICNFSTSAPDRDAQCPRCSKCPNVLQPDVNMKDQEGRVVGSEGDWALTAAKLTTFSSQAGLCRFHVGCN